MWHVINANVITDWYEAAKHGVREAKALSNPVRRGWLTFPTLPFWTCRMDTAATSFPEVRGCLFDHKPHRIARCVATAGWRPQGGQLTNQSCYATMLHSHMTAHICQLHECTSAQKPTFMFKWGYAKQKTEHVWQNTVTLTVTFLWHKRKFKNREQPHSSCLFPLTALKSSPEHVNTQHEGYRCFHY